LLLFNSDLESREPKEVARLRHDIADVDALLIASPEYAHGVSGVMKNTLGRMAASGATMGKPVVLLNASPRASHAIAAWRKTLAVVAARLVDAAGVEIYVWRDTLGGALLKPAPAGMQHALLAIKMELGQIGRPRRS
jgi:NAD(P)H-dependent FMN reductase